MDTLPNLVNRQNHVMMLRSTASQPASRKRQRTDSENENLQSTVPTVGPILGS